MEKKDPSKYEIKEEKLQLIPTEIRRNHKGILCIYICKQIGQSKRNVEISRNSLPRLSQEETI